MPLARLPATIPKCATCDRWSGVRRATGDGGIEFDDREAQGQCVGGPWDGNVRDPFTRCGRWVQWVIAS